MKRLAGQATLPCVSDAEPSPAHASLDVEPFPTPECDENGIDRAQIRRLLELSPAERLSQHDAFMNSVFAIWEQNGHEGFR